MLYLWTDIARIKHYTYSILQIPYAICLANSTGAIIPDPPAPTENKITIMFCSVAITWFTFGVYAN